ncbi:neural cell adhesion molecule 2-like [Lycodopsis pacificus]
MDLPSIRPSDDDDQFASPEATRALEVKVMHSIGLNRFYWPRLEDKIWYTVDKVLALIPPPENVTQRHVQISPTSHDVGLIWTLLGCPDQPKSVHRKGLTFRNVQSPQEFRNGETAEVVCAVIGSLVPVVTWYYQGEEITEEHHSKFTVLPNNNLQIRQVTKADEDVYRCKARGENPFVDIAVVVNVPPVVSVFQPSLNAIADHESVTFNCMTTGSPDPVVTWHRKGRELEPSDQYNIRLDGGRSMLTLRKIRQVDGGSYTCKATNKAGSQEREIVLKVFVQPHITQLKNVTAAEGSAAMISCVAEGEPLPDISWRRASNGQTFVDGDKRQDGRFKVRRRHGKSVLTISGVRLKDLGRFDCAALSRIGGHRKSMFLDIEYIPKFLTNQTIYYSWEGNPVNISCEVMSNPPATMLWRRERLTISVEGTANTRVYSADGKSVLEVTPMSDRDFGRYNCTARNNIGIGFQEFILAQADVPSNPYALRLSDVSQHLMTVTFMKPDSDGGLPISHFLVQYKEVGSEEWTDVKSHIMQTTVVLTGLEPNTMYEVRVAAVNGKGQGEFSHTASFQTIPIPESLFSRLGLGMVVCLGLGALLLLLQVLVLVLMLVDVSCFSLRHCGVLTTSSEGKDREEGKAAYRKLPLKEENGKEMIYFVYYFFVPLWG